MGWWWLLGLCAAHSLPYHVVRLTGITSFQKGIVMVPNLWLLAMSLQQGYLLGFTCFPGTPKIEWLFFKETGSKHMHIRLSTQSFHPRCILYSLNPWQDFPGYDVGNGKEGGVGAGTTTH